MKIANYTRRKTHPVRVGNILIGSDYPVRIQTMANTATTDIEASVFQAEQCFRAGAEILRFTTQGMREVEALKVIHDTLRGKGYTQPLVADVHFRSDVAFAAAEVVEKVRINPGNFCKEQDIDARFTALLQTCSEHNTALRIGVNHGSLAPHILAQYGDTPEGIAASAMQYLRIAMREKFMNIVLSVKASNTRVMVESVRLLCDSMDAEDMHYPLHLGVTEAGEGEDGRIKSAVGIGTLLMEGIGDTIRVSLSEAPEAEIPAAQAILQAAGLLRYKTEFVSCPSCGRTMFNLEHTVKQVKEAFALAQDEHPEFAQLKIAIMGCIVNGPGEMADADYGYVGAGREKVSLYKGRQCVLQNINEQEAVQKLINFIIDDQSRTKNS